MKHASQLHAKVAALNKVHGDMKQILPGVFDILRPYVGKQILLAGGGFIKKIRDVIKEGWQGVDKPHCYFNLSSQYSIWLNFKRSENYSNSRGEDCFAEYAEVAYYLCAMDGLILKELYDDTKRHGDLRTDITAEEVKTLRDEYRAAKSAYDTAKNKLFYFGE